MKLKSNYNKLVDYIFWIVFIVFTNPGDLLLAFGEDRGDGGINVADFLFVVLFGCYIFIFYKKDIGYDRTYIKVVQYFFIILLYYFLVFGYMVPIFRESSQFSITFLIIKGRHTIYSLFLVVMVYRFYLRSFLIFYKLFIISSIIVISLFVFGVVTGIEILPVEKLDRHFVKIDRIFLSSYGLMPLLIYMGIVVIVFKINIKWKKFILIGFGLMLLVWILSLTRRHIFGTLILFIMSVMLYNYFQHKVLISVKRVFSSVIYGVIIFFTISFTFPKYAEASIVTVEETINIIRYSEDSTGRKDTRLGFGRKFIVNLFIDNPLFGTGFDNRWRTHEGDSAGYESADYPLLAALAMYGIIGVLVFLPIYILLIKLLYFDINFLRNHNVDYNTIEFFIFSMFILYFIYDLLLYMNWFRPFSNLQQHEWYIYISMYLASRHLFYSNYFSTKKQINNLK